MSPQSASPIRPTDDQARALAQNLLAAAGFGALGVIEAETGRPLVSRVAVARDTKGGPLTLVSQLSAHTKALLLNPACSLLVGEPGDKGDPLTHPRLTLQCRAEFIGREGSEHAVLRAHFLTQQAKAKLYIDFGDFVLVRLAVSRAYLNGGFGKAFHLTASDLDK